MIRRIAKHGLGFECVSPAEIRWVQENAPEVNKKTILYTPNFAPKEDYQAGFDEGVNVTLDNLYPLKAWPAVFSGQEVFVRIDLGRGRGHHVHVQTGGTHAKFGIPLFELEELKRLSQSLDVKIVGVHAHTGSGVLQSNTWQEVASRLCQIAETFPDVKIIDAGGGLGVPERPGDVPLDMSIIDDSLEEVRKAYPQYQLWMEPGRFLMSEAGVLIAKVTQIKGKGDIDYVGIETGMNSLIRPALYGAYHEIENLSRWQDEADRLFNIVGPICESGDKLGVERLLPTPKEGDVLVIANAGAYGRVMSSDYNMRNPAREVFLGDI